MDVRQRRERIGTPLEWGCALSVSATILAFGLTLAVFLAPPWLRDPIREFATRIRDQHPLIFPLGPVVIALVLLHSAARQRWQKELGEARRERDEPEDGTPS